MANLEKIVDDLSSLASAERMDLARLLGEGNGGHHAGEGWGGLTGAPKCASDELI